MNKLQPRKAKSSRKLERRGYLYTRRNLPLATDTPTPTGHIVIAKPIGQATEQCVIMPAHEHGRTSRAFAGLSRQKRTRRNRVRTDIHVFEAKTRVNRACRGNRLKLMYTLTCADPVTDIAAFDSLIHRFTEKLTEHHIRPWVITRELSKQGNWHAHLALSRREDLQLLIRLWRVGYVHEPDEEQKKSWRAVARYMSKSLADLPPGARRFAFFSKLGSQSKQRTKATVSGSLWDAFVGQVDGVHLNRLSRFSIRGDMVSFELSREGPASRGENKVAMARLGQWALRLARARLPRAGGR